MFRFYMTGMLLVVAAGIGCTVLATTTLVLGLGLLLITVGGGGISAGIMTRDTAP